MGVKFKELMSYYKFDIFPRYIGNPYQYYVVNYNDFYSFLYSNNGMTPLYTTHNSVKNNKIIYVQQFFDLDTDFGATLEEAQQDLIKLYKYFDKYNKIMSFSSNGFHFYLRFEGNYDNQYQLSMSIKNFQQNLKNKLNLKSLNLICAEPRHLARIPGTLRGDNDKILGKRHCIPINISLLEEPLDKIIQHSNKNIWSFEDNEDNKLYDLSSILISDVNHVSNEIINENISFNYENLPISTILRYIEMILAEPLYSQIMTSHPSHTTRLMSAIKIKSAGISLDDALKLFDIISKIAKWDDANNKRLREYQIKYIYSKPLTILQKAMK
jgi:hypothetical protein